MRERRPPAVTGPGDQSAGGRVPRSGSARNRDLGDCALWLVLAALFCIASLRLGVGPLRSPGPGFIPFWAGLGLAVCAGILAVSRPGAPRHAGRRQPAAGEARPLGRLVVVAGLAAYCLALERIGYPVATFGLMLLLFGRGNMRPWVAVGAALVASAASYGLFAQLLKTPLPRGMFGF